MKKNILTIIIMAITLINTVLLALLIFAIVPTSNRTNQLVTKVASIVDLELEDTQDSEVAVSDIITQKLEDKLTITLNSSSADPHYAILFLSLSMNSKNEDYELLSGKITENEGPISEIVTEEFGKYTIDNVQEHKEDIRQAVLTRVQELFQSDFIINVSFGNVVYN
ncbi:MAG: putative rane protein [Herbinix sp.]|jgi:flagellar FliL protein|nr:putative rane protein [Herbinix sp.]